MRLILAALAPVFTVCLVTTTPALAQQQQQRQQPQQQQTIGQGTRPSPLHMSFNSCVELAMQRGWTYSDLYDDRAEVRRFVIDCMQGRQQ
jgi:hypothetical protein